MPMPTRKPHTVGWLVGAIICSLLPVPLALFVYKEWQQINEFTMMVTMIPALLVLLLSCAAVILWLVWILQFVRSRKFQQHQKVVREISLDVERRHVASRVKASHNDE